MFHSDRMAERPGASEPKLHPVHRDGDSFLTLGHLAGEIWRRKGLLILAMLLGAVLAAAYALSTPKQYTAYSQLVLDPRDLNIVQNDVTVGASGLSTDATIAIVESQIAVIGSNTVLERVVSQAGLTADPEFNGLRETLLSGITSVVGALFSSEDEIVQDRERLTVINLGRRLTVTRNANSFVINVGVRTESPDKSARIANIVTETFIAEQGRAQSDVARRATAALSSRLAELRQRVTDAEDAAEAYKAETNLVGVGGRLIDDDYITRINNQLAEVRTQITALDVRAQSLRQASVGDVVEGSFPEGLNSEQLQRLRQTYAEAAQSAAVLSTRLGPRHPQRLAADEALAAARRAIQTELGRIVASAQTELDRARDTETDLSRQIEALRSRQIETSGAFVRLRELQREVDASRAVYEAYLLRARQTSEMESLNTVNVRVISEATPPLQPSGLSRRLLVMAGAVLGLGVGVGLALLAALLSAGRAGMSHSGAPIPGSPASGGLGDRHPRRIRETSANEASPPPERAAAPAAAAAAGWNLRGPSTEAVDRAPRPSGDAASVSSEEGFAAAGERGEEPADRAIGAEGSPDDAHPVRFGPRALVPADSEPFHDGHDDDGEFHDNGTDLDRRRNELRERIRAIGLRRSSGRPLPEEEEEGAAPAADMPRGEARTSAETARERISLTLAAARRRRDLLLNPSP